MGTTLTKTFKGDVWNTNLIISMVTGTASSVIYSVGGSAFDAGKLAAVLWLASVVMKLKDASFDVSTLKDSPVETGVAAISTFDRYSDARARMGSSERLEVPRVQCVCAR